MRENMKTKSNWKLGAAVGTALSLGSGAAVAGPVSYTHLTLPTKA